MTVIIALKFEGLWARARSTIIIINCNVSLNYDILLCKKKATPLTWITPAPLDEDDRGDLTQLGSPVLGSQAADAGVSPAVAAAHRARGGADTGVVEPTVRLPHRVAPQPVTAGDPATGLTLPGRAHDAAAASVLQLLVVAGLRWDGALRGIADLRATLFFAQHTCMNCGGEESEVNYKFHYDIKNDSQ